MLVWREVQLAAEVGWRTQVWSLAARLHTAAVLLGILLARQPDRWPATLQDEGRPTHDTTAWHL